MKEKTLFEQKKQMLNRIIKYRKMLINMINNRSVSEEQILKLLSMQSNDFLSNYNDMSDLFINIYLIPSILCDISLFSSELKDLIPFVINGGYERELNELEYQFNQGMISLDEYNESKNVLNFAYYESSCDGEKICRENYNNKIIKK